jgi:hypothetical protein
MQRIFIVGCPRSGTTLVQAMLARHPAVLTLPETAFFEHLYGHVSWRWGDLDARPPRRRLRQRLGFTRRNARAALQGLHHVDPRAFLPQRWPLRTEKCVNHFVELLDARAQDEGCAVWVEKTPSHLLYINEIEQNVPGARFVHVIRPGEEVLASIADASLHYDNFNAYGIGTVPWARRWNHAVRIHREHAQQPHHHFVFLDDLTRDPQREWRRLCDFLGIDGAAELGVSDNRSIADLRNEPWKRDALSGEPGKAKRKVESLFGPKLHEWLQRQLVSYDELHRSCIGGSQPAERDARYLYR